MLHYSLCYNVKDPNRRHRCRRPFFLARESLSKLRGFLSLLERNSRQGRFNFEIAKASFDDTPRMGYIEEDELWHHRDSLEHIEIDFVGR